MKTLRGLAAFILVVTLLAADSGKSYTVTPRDPQLVDTRKDCGLMVTISAGKDVDFLVPCMGKEDMAQMIALFTKAPGLQKELQVANEITLTVTTKTNAQK